MKRFLTGAALALAAGLCLGAPARATVVTFGTHGFSCGVGAPVSHQGLSFDMSWYRCYYSPTEPADFPTTLTSSVLATGFVDTLITTGAGVAFDLNAVDLALGPIGDGGNPRPDDATDITTLTANFQDGSSQDIDLTVAYGFRTYQLGLKDLTSVNFSSLHTYSDYLAFDNIDYTALGANPVPEPAVWLTVLLGFSACGFMLRRARELALAPID
ncbi:MAG TPA: PEP-CTERM sorting domain-containing protein [Phenylobacterium sp.]